MKACGVISGRICVCLRPNGAVLSDVRIEPQAPPKGVCLTFPMLSISSHHAPPSKGQRVKILVFAGRPYGLTAAHLCWRSVKAHGRHKPDHSGLCSSNTRGGAFGPWAGVCQPLLCLPDNYTINLPQLVHPAQLGYKPHFLCLCGFVVFVGEVCRVSTPGPEFHCQA